MEDPYNDPRAFRHKFDLSKMVKRATKRRRTQAGKEERAMQKIDRAVRRYGASAVAKYYDPGYSRTSGYYGRFAGPGAELKFFDTSLSFPVDATGEVPATGQLNLIPQGTTESQRIGRKCVIKSIQLRGIATFAPAAAATAADVVNLFVVLDKQCNGAAAAFTDVFVGSSANTSLRNMANSSRFVILKTYRWAFNPMSGATTAYNNTTRTFDWYKRCNIPLEFSSTTGAIGEIRSNNIFLLAQAVQDDLTTVTGVCRVRFSDS